MLVSNLKPQDRYSPRVQLVRILYVKNPIPRIQKINSDDENL